MTDIRFRSDVSVDLIDSMGSEQSIVRAARVSTLGTNAEATEAAGLIRFLARENHGTPFEAPVLSIRIEAPVTVTRQLLKYRLSSINEWSGRYSEMEGVFYMPTDDRPAKQVGKTGNYTFVHDERAIRTAQEARKAVAPFAWEWYKKQLENGVAKELARGVLPFELYSSLIMTANLRSWINVIRQRTNRYGQHPQYEIALVGEKVRDILSDKFPTVIDALDKGELHV